eukprot:14537425-Alexandrium_andersonii.AAC.1
MLRQWAHRTMSEAPVGFGQGWAKMNKVRQVGARVNKVWPGSTMPDEARQGGEGGKRGRG